MVGVLDQRSKTLKEGRGSGTVLVHLPISANHGCTLFHSVHADRVPFFKQVSFQMRLHLHSKGMVVKKLSTNDSEMTSGLIPSFVGGDSHGRFVFGSSAIYFHHLPQRLSVFDAALIFLGYISNMAPTLKRSLGLKRWSQFPSMSDRAANCGAWVTELMLSAPCRLRSAGFAGTITSLVLLAFVVTLCPEAQAVPSFTRQTGLACTCLLY